MGEVVLIWHGDKESVLDFFEKSMISIGHWVKFNGDVRLIPNLTILLTSSPPRPVAYLPTRLYHNDEVWVNDFPLNYIQPMPPPLQSVLSLDDTPDSLLHVDNEIDYYLMKCSLPLPPCPSRLPLAASSSSSSSSIHPLDCILQKLGRIRHFTTSSGNSNASKCPPLSWQMVISAAKLSHNIPTMYVCLMRGGLEKPSNQSHFVRVIENTLKRLSTFTHSQDERPTLLRKQKQKTSASSSASSTPQSKDWRSPEDENKNNNYISSSVHNSPSASSSIGSASPQQEQQSQPDSTASKSTSTGITGLVARLNKRPSLSQVILQNRVITYADVVGSNTRGIKRPSSAAGEGRRSRMSSVDGDDETVNKVPLSVEFLEFDDEGDE